MTNPDVFTARNGLSINFAEPEGLTVSHPDDHHPTTVTPDRARAIYEYGRQTQDKELGRDRDTTNQFIVIYPDEDRNAVAVMDEHNPTHTKLLFRGDTTRNTGNKLVDAAHRWFTTNPPAPDKPWTRAQPGQVWVIKRENRTYWEPVTVIDMRPEGLIHTWFGIGEEPFMPVDDRDITDARCIWDPDTDDPDQVEDIN